jgi:hypothetical protein
MRNATYIATPLAGALLAGVLLAACAGPGPAAPAVPTAAQGGGAAAGQAGQGGAGQGGAGQAAGSARAAALHAAAQCIRQHGIPSYQDPVLAPGGRVYSDLRSIEEAPDATISAIQQACGTLAARAGLSPKDEPPAPPQLVQAGVRAARCMRAHGLPNVHDPTGQSPYTPGHGFGMTASEVPAGGKASPVYQAAAHACRALLDDEIRASTLTSLSHDG